MNKRVYIILSAILGIIILSLLYSIHNHLQMRNKVVVLVRSYFQSFKNYAPENNSYYFTEQFLVTNELTPDTGLYNWLLSTAQPNQNTSVKIFELVWWYADKYPVKPVDIGSDNTSAYVSLSLGVSTPVIVTLHFKRMGNRLKLHHIANINAFYSYLRCRQKQLILAAKPAVN